MTKTIDEIISGLNKICIQFEDFIECDEDLEMLREFRLLIDDLELLNKTNVSNDWKLIETAPKDGTEIETSYDGEDCSTAFWSDRPVCMLGSRNGGHPPGWATGLQSGTDFNLPIDEPTHWRHL